MKLGRPKVAPEVERKARRQLAKGVGVLKTATLLGIGTGTGAADQKRDAHKLTGDWPVEVSSRRDCCEAAPCHCRLSNGAASDSIPDIGRVGRFLRH